MKKVKYKLFGIILATFALLFLTCNFCYAAVPHLINYQGRLTDTSGNPLNGSYNLTFRIYDAETAGNLLWEEVQSGVVIQKGTFSILLGSVTNLGLPFDKPYFLEIKVGNEVMTPRQRITSAGYAIRAEKAEQANNADTISNVGVNTSPVPNKLLPLDTNGKLPASVLKIYDSGWFAVVSDTTYNRAHGLGTSKIMVNIFYSNTYDGSGDVVVVGGSSSPNASLSNNNQLTVVDIDSSNISIRTRAEIVDYIDKNGVDHNDVIAGYCRILALALE